MRTGTGFLPGSFLDGCCDGFRGVGEGQHSKEILHVSAELILHVDGIGKKEVRER